LERDLGFRMVNAGELLRGLEQGKFYKNGGTIQAARGMEVGRFYKDKSGNSFRYIGENMQGDTLFNDGERVIVKSANDFVEEPNEKRRFSFFEDGGMMAKDVKVYSVDMQPHFTGRTFYIVESNKGVEEFSSDKEFHDYIYKLENEGYERMADGGFVEKTDEELKGMSDEELFEYLDAKAAYMKPHTRPLSSFKAKNFAARAAAVQFQNEGTSKLEANFPDIAKIREQAEQDYQEGVKRIAQKRRKMLGGGYTSSFSGTPDRRRVTKEKGGQIKGYQLGDMWSSDFDYDGMLKKGLEADSSWEISKLNKLSNSFEDVNYHTENKPLYEAIQNLKNGNKTKAEEKFKEFHKLLREELGIKETPTTIKSEGSTSVKDRLKNIFNKAKTATQQGYNKSKEYTKKQIHDQKKKVALSVIDETKVKASTKSEKNKLSDAKQIVSKKYVKGGKVTFDDKVKAIKSSLLKNKKVPTKVQKDYGKTYNPKEAEQAAKRIAGAMRKKEMK
jgi:hypothetical protein